MKYILGLDLGNQNFRLVLGTQTKNFKPRIICVLERPSEGLSKGSIVDFENFVKSLKRTLDEFKGIVGRLPKNAVINVMGPHFSVKVGKGAAPVSRADGEISEADTAQVLEKSKNISVSPNKMILHVISREYKVDDLEGIKDPIGMHGIKLEVESLIVEIFHPNIKTIKKAFDEIDYKIEDMVFTPLASAWACLSKKQEEVGTAVIDLGAENTNLSVYEDGKILTATSFPVGANHITHDIAICLKTSLDIAEKIKLAYGSAIASEVSRKDTIDLSKISRELDNEISKKYLAEIIEARLEEIFDFVADELKKIGRQGKLPGGLVLVGGGAKLPQIVDFAKSYLKLPARIGHPVKLELEDTPEEIAEIIDDPSFAVADGLFLWAFNNMSSGKINIPSPLLSRLKKIVKIFVP
ncbi:MAG TPA: cell division protein FtsA [Candidatus Paceibacterota bacterium]|nr:cell division protein FtsA [Candidatus Paceibacterota bacterium]